jgi:hypothetical protein
MHMPESGLIRFFIDEGGAVNRKWEQKISRHNPADEKIESVQPVNIFGEMEREFANIFGEKNEATHHSKNSKLGRGVGRADMSGAYKDAEGNCD